MGIKLTSERGSRVQRLRCPKKRRGKKKGWVRRLHCRRLRFRSSSPRGASSSSSLSAVSVGLRRWAMLPRRVDGADESFTVSVFRLSLRLAAFQDQSLKLSRPVFPLEKGG